ncbi:MAG: heme exporter protein CcmD [Myxococcota bacterium]
MSYVVAAYGITALVLVGYVVMLHREKARLRRDD